MDQPLISVVCPFYNEEAILDAAVHGMLEGISRLGEKVELILVNDGSTDGSGEMAGQLAAESSMIRLVSYPVNQGRGHALKQGIDAAVGEIIVTTEVDLSWGEDIVARLAQALRLQPKADMVVASPHLPSGGYKNVPAKRVHLSAWGNKLLRLLVSDRVSMFTGMTRAYRAQCIQGLETYEKGKEFHLEVILKALSLGWNVVEIPCILEWKSHKLSSRAGAPKRVSSTNIPRIVYSHLLFSFSANPSKYLILASLPVLLLSLLSLVAGAVSFFMGQVAIYLFMVSGILCIISMNLFLFALLARQNSAVLAECWRLQRQVREFGKALRKDLDRTGAE